MKKLLLSLCICLALVSLPCSPHAEELSLTKPGRVVTTSLLGLSFGALIGAAVAAFSTSSTATPIFIGAGAGFVLGFVLAASTPTEAVEGASHGSAVPAMPLPSGLQAAGSDAGAFR